MSVGYHTWCFHIGSGDSGPSTCAAHALLIVPSPNPSNLKTFLPLWTLSFSLILPVICPNLRSFWEGRVHQCRKQVSSCSTKTAMLGPIDARQSWKCLWSCWIDGRVDHCGDRQGAWVPQALLWDVSVACLHLLVPKLCRLASKCFTSSCTDN